MYIIQIHNFLSCLTIKKKLRLQKQSTICADSVEIYKVYKRLNKSRYSFISIQKVVQEETGTSNLKNCYSNIRDIAGLRHGFKKNHHLYVINPYFLDTRNYENYIDMWDESANHMVNQSGFIRARLFRTLTERNKVKLVSIAEWENESSFLSKFDSDSFKEIIKSYEAVFAITFNRKI